MAAAGIVVVLAASGIGKFTMAEIEDLRPVFSGSALLSWMPPTLGDAGSSYLIGVTELATAALVAASPFSRRTGIAGGALGTLTFAVTTSLLLSPTPDIWEEKSGGPPHPSSWGFFLLKDIVLLGAAMVVLGSSLARPGKTGGDQRR